MGAGEPAFNDTAFKAALRQGKYRLGLKRGQKVNNINKKKKEIQGHLQSGNEMLALIHVFIVMSSI